MRALLAYSVVLLLSPPLAAEEMVRIAVFHGLKQVNVSGQGLRVRARVKGERYLTTPGGRSTVDLRRGVLYVDGASRPGEAVRLKADGPIHVAGHGLRGILEVRQEGDGLLAINEISLEDYLAAVLGGEMPSSFPLEALKAQAVAARSYAVQRKIATYGKSFHMGATVLNQVYGGLASEDPATREAVRATRGEVLTFQMAPIEAYFHSSCGGQTESGRDALGRDLPYLKPVECVCKGETQTAWDLPLGKPGAQGLRDVKVLDRTETGRVRRALLVADAGKRVVDGAELRKLLGYDKLRSLAFTPRKAADGTHLSGTGSGHAAGLCQWGAKGYAERGWDYRKILMHYYPGAELRTMY